MMLPETLLAELTKLGYTLSAEEGRIKFSYRGAGDPPADRARPLLILLGEKKAEVVAVLQSGDRRRRLDYFNEPLICGACGSRSFWISIHGAQVCPLCHPPAHPSLIKTWIGRSSNLIEGKHGETN